MKRGADICLQTTAKLARVFRMKILALRRRTELSSQEKEEGLEVTALSRRFALHHT